MRRAYLVLVFLGIVFVLAGSASAVMLSDGQLYLDPAGLIQDFYPRVELPDLAMQNNHVWTEDGDPIVDADILPILLPGDYPYGYAYSQSDYVQQPNLDYAADLTAGTLTAWFYVPGLYHVRIFRNSGAVEVYAVFAESGLKEENGKPDKTGPSKKISPTPKGDLFIVENSDDVMNKSAKVWKNNGRKVERVDNTQQAIDKIKARSQALGRKIHVELDGHGSPGNISLGDGKSHEVGKHVGLKEAAAFQKSIDDYVNHITFQGCSVGSGKKGKQYLQIMADSIGKAGAWDYPVTVVNESYFTVPTCAKWNEVVVDLSKPKYHIPVIVNCVGSTTCDVKTLIKKANEKLKKARIKLYPKQINTNVQLGNNDDKTNPDEIGKLDEEGKKELAKVFKGKNGKWTGKGLKLYVTNDCWEGLPAKVSWFYRHGHSAGIENISDLDEMARRLARVVTEGMNPKRIGDINDLSEMECANIRAEAAIVGTAVQECKLEVTPNGAQTGRNFDQKVRIAGGEVDASYDITGAPDPCDPMFAYADIQTVTISSGALTDPNRQITIRVALNGLLPGTLPNGMSPGNPDRPFDAHCMVELIKDSTVDMIDMHLWMDDPAAGWQTEAMYTGGGYVGPLQILDMELGPEPNLPGEYYQMNHVLELRVPADAVCDGIPPEPCSEGMLCDVVVTHTVDDGGFFIQDTVTGPAIFVVQASPMESPAFHIVPPSGEAAGDQMGVAISGVEPDAMVEVTVDGELAGVAQVDVYGDTFLLVDPAIVPGFDYGTHEIEVAAISPLGDTTNMTVLDGEFVYSPREMDADLNDDGDVNLEDFAIVAASWLD